MDTSLNWECWVDDWNSSGISEQGEQLSVSVVHMISGKVDQLSLSKVAVLNQNNINAYKSWKKLE